MRSTTIQAGAVFSLPFATRCRSIPRHPNVVPVTVGQIKSKFGELHFFYEGGDAYCRGAVDLAAGLSLKTCERCGAPGKHIEGQWVSTLCSTHDGSSTVAADRKLTQ